MSISINKNYPCNSDNYAVTSSRDILYLVYHFVGAEGTALQNVIYFMNNAGLQASAHFFVGHASEDAQIYQSVDPKNRAWHCGATTYKHAECRNSNSIGIEMCCHKDSSGNWYFDDETIDMAVELGKYLMAAYDIDADHVVRHYDVTGKNCPAPFVEDESAWEDFLARLSVDTTATTNTTVEDDDKMGELYSYLSDIPNDYGFRDIIEALMNAGVIKGDGSDESGNGDKISLYSSQVRLLVFIYRGGGFDKALAAAGLEPAISD